ncbi:MAG: photosystem II complex extrinsic protein PsbU [Synechococcaceae cyanobacterium]|nr:photosystem II complex extrinsic protein PsbU [Synechococcaceae cyanobacterium]
MKRLLAWLMSSVVMAGLLIGLLLPGAAYAAELRNVADDKIAESGGKVDLNNSSVRRFQQYPGMYPTLAGKIVLGGPYQSVDDVLKLDLTDRQKELFEKYKDNFTVTPPSIALNEGFDRINDGVYR